MTAARALQRSRTGLRDGLAYFRRRHDPLTSLVLTIPVFLVYHLGILWIQHRNGADLVSGWMLALIDYSVWGYVGLTVGVAAMLVLALAYLRRRGSVRPASLAPVIAASGLWALVMLVSVGWATARLFALQLGPPALGPLDKLVMAAGAGFHEELLFRAGLFAGGGRLLWRSTRMRQGVALAWAALLSAMLFAAVHHVGAFGDAFTWPRFTFRTLAGLFLTGLYAWRGFAVAVYTHALYDVLVFFSFGE